MVSKEADNKLAMSAVDTQKIRSSCSTATIYDVDERTLRRRYARVVARLDCHPNSKKLAQTEEEVIVQRILDPDQRGFPLTYAAVRDMANKLLATRGVGQVGQKWPSDFIRHTDSIKTPFNRAYDSQRALCKDPVLIRNWFRLVEGTKTKYGICDDNVYNFDEAGFMMGRSRLSSSYQEHRGEADQRLLNQVIGSG
jgi:hypothetical protein